MSRKIRHLLGLRISIATLIGLAVIGCSDDRQTGQASAFTPSDQAQVPDPTEADDPVVTPPAARVTDLPPNELGQILVLEYHRLGEPEGEFRRSVENFRGDLRLLYDAGYRPITMRQMVEGRIDVPYGATPVVFTIDDSSTGQFYYLADGSIDPNSMVGMWSAFRAEHPDWEHGATWCVLPAADHPSNFFGELPSREVPRAEREERIHRKVDYLVNNGHEICNHTLYHARLDRATGPTQVQEWIGRGEDSIRVYLPEDYEVVTLALPLGMWPQERSLAWSGTHAGREYSYKAVLEVTGGPSESPFDTAFNPRSVKRFIVAPNHLERQLAAYESNPVRRFVSDGDPMTVSVRGGDEDRFASVRWPDHRMVVLRQEHEGADAPPANDDGGG